MTGDYSECVELKCALLATLIAKHGWGSPIEKDSLVNDAGIPSHQQGDGKDAFDDLRRASFVINCGKRGIKINTSNQGELATYLENKCDWSPVSIDLRLKHYEGYKDKS